MVFLEDNMVLNAQKPVVIIRHGKYSGNKLTQLGVAEVTVTAQWLKEYVGEDQVLVLYSPVARAEETAKIVAEKVNGTLVPRTILNGEGGDWDEFQATMERLQRRPDVKLIVLVTHYDVVELLIERFGQTSGAPVDRRLRNAEALVLKNGAYMCYIPGVTYDN
jgi:phosphohistidine phosphatase SixA